MIYFDVASIMNTGSFELSMSYLQLRRITEFSATIIPIFSIAICVTNKISESQIKFTINMANTLSLSSYDILIK